MIDVTGNFMWYELHTTDVEAASAFYSDVVGWNRAEIAERDVADRVWTAGARSVAAAVGAPARGVRQTTADWISYVAVHNVAATIDGVERLGGRVRQSPSDVQGVGRHAIVVDPQGASIGLLSPEAVGDRRDFRDQAAPGQVCWHELYTPDPSDAFAFYSQIFGWQKSRSFDMGPAGAYQVFSVAGQDVGGVMRQPPTMPAPLWNPFVRIDDITSAGARVTAADGKIFDGLREVPGGLWTLKCVDPQGATFALTGRTT
jgi:predicted enzyme related to lactoylglutathione lyase